MIEIVLSIGLPASGKSTYARKLVAESNGSWIQVNKDELREMLHISIWDKQKEKVTVAMRNAIIEQALMMDKNIIVSDTNFQKEHFKDICLIAQQFNKDITVKEKYFPVELDEAIRRNEERIKNGYRTTVTESVIRNTYDRYVRGKKIEERKETFFGGERRSIMEQSGTKNENGSEKCNSESEVSNKKDRTLAIICDLDGTLALVGDRSFYNAENCHEVDTINTPVLETVKALYNEGYQIIFCSGREDKYEGSTRKFINKYWSQKVERVTGNYKSEEIEEVLPYQLFMRKTGDMRKDSIVKKEIYQEHIEPNYEVLLCLDDRQQVVRGWRDLGLVCFQVAPGMF